MLPGGRRLGAWPILRMKPARCGEMAACLPEVERPVVLQGALAELADLLALRGEADVRFDAIVGRGTLTSSAYRDKD